MKGIIFDLDGTLLDTIKDITINLNHALSQHGLPIYSEDDYKLFIGNGARNLVMRAVPNEELVDIICDEYRAKYRAHIVDNTEPYNGIVAMLEALQARDIPIAVLSNKPHEDTLFLIKNKLSNINFKIVQGGINGAPHKPDPRALDDFLTAMNCTASELIMVGDSGIDMEFAIKTGMCGVGVLWGFRDIEELVKSGAQHIVNTAKELEELLIKMLN